MSENKASSGNFCESFFYANNDLRKQTPPASKKVPLALLPLKQGHRNPLPVGRER